MLNCFLFCYGLDFLGFPHDLPLTFGSFGCLNGCCVDSYVRFLGILGLLIVCCLLGFISEFTGLFCAMGFVWGAGVVRFVYI